MVATIEPKKTAKRRTKVTKPHCEAECLDCDWTLVSANALGVAAQHTDRHGHETRVEVTRVIRYVPGTGADD